MIISSESALPIYMQIAEGIEDDILNGLLKEEEQVMSTNQFAQVFHINPATAAKGINLLVDEGVLYKKRGLGMYVASGALKIIKKRRKRKFYDDYVYPILQEANRLDITKEELIELISRGENE